MNNAVLKRAIIKVIGIAGVAAFSSSLQAASFDCTKASTTVEKLICQDNGLSRADDNLAIAYQHAMSAVSDKEALKNQQRTWLKDTRNKCQDTYCLYTAYRNQESLLFQAEMQAKEAEGKVGKYIWVGDALNGIGDLVSKAEDKPLCQAFRENLNSFPSINPMTCGLKLNESLGFKPLDWKSIDISKYEGMFSQIYRMEKDSEESWKKNFKNFKNLANQST